MQMDLQSLIDMLYDAMARAELAGSVLANSAALATADAGGRPSVRFVLLKDADDRGFVFYTNMESRKAKELDVNPSASLCFWWGSLQEQVRVEGTTERVGDQEADEYFASRPRGSQIGAWASNQSATLESREALEEAADRVAAEYEGREVPRPPFWSGYRLIPERIEFWYGREDRLHDRLLYTRDGDRWLESRLYP